MKLRKGRKPRGPKRVSYQIIGPESAVGKPMYDLLGRLVREHHREILNARIALAWCSSWRADVDGRVILGKCKKASDLDRELATHDFVILLNRDFWGDPSVTDAQRAALIDHELCHATIKRDRQGEPEEDERGRPVYRMRKHDLEEFAEIVERHGLWKRDLELFAQAMRRSPQQALPMGEETEAPAKRRGPRPAPVPAPATAH